VFDGFWSLRQIGSISGDEHMSLAVDQFDAHSFDDWIRIFDNFGTIGNILANGNCSSCVQYSCYFDSISS
jgi:hypothetical protein